MDMLTVEPRPDEVPLPGEPSIVVIDVSDLAQKVVVVDVAEVPSPGEQGPPGPPGTTDWNGITNKPATFPPTLPIPQSGVSNLTVDLSLKANLSGATMTGKFNAMVSSAAGAGFNIGQGAGPSAAADGDLWLSGASLSWRGSGVGYVAVSLSGTQTLTGNKTFSGTGNAISGKMTFNASLAGGAKIALLPGVVPTAPIDGDLWTTSAGLFVRINGTTVGPLGAGGAGATDWNSITNKPSTFPPTVPISQADITNLINDLSAKAAVSYVDSRFTSLVGTASSGWDTLGEVETATAVGLAGKAPTVHTHAQADITNLTTDLAAKAALAGATFTGKLTAPASAAGGAGFNIGGAGVGPSAPVDGDIYLTATTMVVRHGVSNRTVVYAEGTQAISGAKTFSAKASFAPSAAGGAGLNIGSPHVAPSAPVDGDLWFSGGFLQLQQAGATFTMVNSGNTQTISGNKTFSGAGNLISGVLAVNAPGTTGRFRLTPGSAPSAPLDGDLWTTTAGLFARINGATQQVSPGWVQMTQAAYDALTPKDTNMLYVIVG